MEAFHLKLRHPFQSPVNKAQITDVTLRRPVKLKDLIVAEKSSTHEAEKMRALLARLAGLDISEMDELSRYDYEKLLVAAGEDGVDEEGKG